MKKSALTLLALAGLMLPASALANVSTPNAALASPMIALPALPPAQALPCHTVLINFMNKMKSAEYQDKVRGSAMVMSGDEGYAESCRGGGEGFCMPGADVTISSNELAGSVKVTEFKSTASSTLGFRVAIVDGVAKIKYRFKGKAYTGDVDSCSGGYWTANTSSSAIVVKLENPQLVQTPE